MAMVLLGHHCVPRLARWKPGSTKNGEGILIFLSVDLFDAKTTLHKIKISFCLAVCLALVVHFRSVLTTAKFWVWGVAEQNGATKRLRACQGMRVPKLLICMCTHY